MNRLQLIQGLQDRLREKVEEIRINARRKLESSMNPNQANQESPSADRAFLGKIHEEEEEEEDDHFDEIPPFVPSSSQLQGKILSDPSQSLISRQRKEFVWMILPEQQTLTSASTSSSQSGSDDREYYSDLFKFGLMWRLKLSPDFNTESEDALLLSIQLAQSNVDFRIDLAVTCEIFVPGGGMMQPAATTYAIFEPYTHGSRPLISIPADLVLDQDKSISIRVELAPASMTAVDEDFEGDFDCLKYSKN